MSLPGADKLSLERIIALLIGLYRMSWFGNKAAYPILRLRPALLAEIDDLIGDHSPLRFAGPTRFLGAPELLTAVAAAAPAFQQGLRARPAAAASLANCYDLVAAVGALAGLDAAVGQVTIEPDMYRHLAHLNYIYVEPKDMRPGLILACGPGDIQLPGDHPALRRVAVRYSTEQTYPTLLLRTPSQMGKEREPQERSRRLQKPGERYDLELYNYSRLLLGYVRTSIVQGPKPIEVEGQRIRLRLNLGPGDRLLYTRVHDVYESELLCCVRLLAAQAPETG